MLKTLAIGIVRVYQRSLSRIAPGSCRFEPTCSEYAVQALERHGVIYGTWLAVKRVARCNPFFSGGLDPVPPPRATNPASEEALPHRTANCNSNREQEPLR